jgi:hypothetical protein
MLAYGSVVSIHPEDSVRYFSCACMGGRKSSCVFFEYLLYEKVLLLWSQPLLVYVASLVALSAAYVR